MFSKNALPHDRRGRLRRRCRVRVEWLEDRTLLSGTAGDVLAGIAIPIALGTPTTGTLAAGDTVFYQVNPTAEGKLVAQVDSRGRRHAALAAERPGPGAHAERRPVARQPRRPDRRGRPGGARVPRGGKPRRREHLHLDDLLDASHRTVSADSDFRG